MLTLGANGIHDLYQGHVEFASKVVMLHDTTIQFQYS